ncbi:MAG TPA: host attachment protein [Thermomicrobiales bacterium]|nr:host attachment protein [Thermomicrobiales bacterium]
MAATNPTRSIRQYEHPSAFDMSAADLLNRLSALPPATDVPYLTVTLDWQIAGGQPGRRDDLELKRSQTRNVDPSGGSNRPSLTQVEQELRRLIEEQGPRGEIRESLEKDRDKITEWLRTKLDPSAQGAFIVANAKHGVFEATGLALPLKTRVRLAPTPQLYRLVRMIEDHPTYAVLVVDQANAELSFITRGQRAESVELTSSLYPRHQQTGAFNQRRYQNRANERVEAFARDICDQVARAVRETGVETLVLMGSEVMMTTIERAMGDDLKALIAKRIRTETPVEEHRKIELTLPIAARAELDAEAAVVSDLAERLGEGSGAATGTADTLRALQNGQVDELVMLDTFREPGWADYSLHLFGVGDIPAEHPVGGDIANIHPVDLRHEMIRLALASGSHIDVIHSEGIDGEARTVAATKLDDMGDVGAILRYTT